MAFNVAALAAYVDEISASGDIWQKSILGGDTAPFLARFNTKANTLKLPIMSADQDVFQDGNNCTFAASGDTTFGQGSISLTNLKVQETYCIRDLEDKFTGVYLPQGQDYSELPLGAMQIDEIAARIVAENELLTWQGNTMGGVGSLLLADGFIFTINANIASVATGAAISTGAITSANALGFVEGLVNAAVADANTGSKVFNGGFDLYLGVDAMRNYDLNYRTTYGTYVLADPMGTKTVQGTNVRMIPVGGLTGQPNMYLTPTNNFSMAVDLESDMTNVRVGTDQYNENVWINARWKAGYGVRDFSQVFVHE